MVLVSTPGQMGVTTKDSGKREGSKVQVFTNGMMVALTKVLIKNYYLRYVL
jgi:hypothetical protein